MIYVAADKELAPEVSATNCTTNWYVPLKSPFILYFPIAKTIKKTHIYTWFVVFKAVNQKAVNQKWNEISFL